MHSGNKILAVLALATSALAATELSVTVTDGPTECADEEKVAAGMNLSMHYTGSIDESSETGEKGKVFDSSVGRGQTFDFEIGQGRVIKGWDEGLVGLCKGAKATLVIPPEMGYGESGAGADIPGGATLKFEVEVVDISDDAPPQPNFFAQIDTDGSGDLTKEEVEAYFKDVVGRDIPEGLWEGEDKDGDGIISWEEFSGPKGDGPTEL